jgi:hypothetical protein
VDESAGYLLPYWGGYLRFNAWFVKRVLFEQENMED